MEQMSTTPCSQSGITTGFPSRRTSLHPESQLTMGSALVLLLRTEERVKRLIWNKRVCFVTQGAGVTPRSGFPLQRWVFPLGQDPYRPLGMGISGCWSWDRVPEAQSPQFLEVAASVPFLRARKAWDRHGKNESRNTVARHRCEMPAPHAPAAGPSKATLGSSRDKSPLCVRARGHLRVPTGAGCGWAAGGTGADETGADQKSVSAWRGEHARAGNAATHCRKKSQNSPKYWKPRSRVLV